MTWSLRDVDVRTVVTLVVLDAVTYMAVYWFVVPSLGSVLAVLPAATLLAVTVTVSAVRLVLVGFYSARSLRARVGFASRAEALPSIVAGTLVATVLQTTMGLVSNALTGMPADVPALLSGIAQWLVFPMLGLLFVAPGAADVFARRGVRR